MAMRRRTRGYSLLELLIASAILGSLLALGVPQLSRMRAPYAADGAAKRIKADLQMARQQAIARNVRYRVNFGTTSYTVEREVAPGNFAAATALMKLPTGTSLTAPNPSNPIFDTRGMLVGNVTLTVTTTNATTRTITINVLGKTTIS